MTTTAGYPTSPSRPREGQDHKANGAANGSAPAPAPLSHAEEPAPAGPTFRFAKLPPRVKIAMKRRRTPLRNTARLKERDIERLVASGLAERRAKITAVGLVDEADRGKIVRPLPRRKFAKAAADAPQAENLASTKESFDASPLETIARCLVWAKLFFLFRVGVLWDRLQRRDTIDTRAARVLSLFQQAGGSLIKIGQQLAMREDVLPHAYCRELAKLLDAVEPFPVEAAIKAVERTTRKPIGETFSAFDPKPIGSASIACVYQAVLKNGEKVAVKVRRPNIGNVFARDLKALHWLITFLETVAIVRPGYMRNFVQEFRETILEELDFRMEAYHQSIFRKDASAYKIKGKPICSAPRVHYDILSSEVIVQEFTSGMWMWEILSAVESNDPAGLARMHQLGINPQIIAEKIMFVQFWGQLVATIFHADPHPANILVQRNNSLVFIDFGACGHLTRAKKDMNKDLLYYGLKKDVSGTVRTMISFMEPLPPIDMEQFKKELELQVAQNGQRTWSKRAPWYEKTSAANMFSLFTLMQQYNIPANLDTVRSFRSNMLYDTLAMRLYHDLDMLRCVKRFFKSMDVMAKKDSTKALRKRLSKGLIDGSQLRSLGEMGELMTRGMQTVRQMLDRPIFNFSFMVEKSVFAVIEVVRLISILIITTLVPTLAVAIFRRSRHLDLNLFQILVHVTSNRVFEIVVGVTVLVTIRRIMLRLRDQEVS